MITVAELTSAEQLAEYQLLWRRLLDDTPGGSVFQSREWLVDCARQAGTAWSWRTLVVSVAQRPIGIVPLVIRNVPTGCGWARALTFPAAHPGHFQGVIGRNPTATLMAAFQHLARGRRDWDLIDLRGVDLRRDGGRTANGFRLAGLPVATRHWQQVAMVELNQIPAGQQFLYRRELRARERDLWRQAEWEHVVWHADPTTASGCQTPDLEALWLQLAPQLATESAERLQFLKLAAVAAARQQALTIQLLKVSGRPVAGLLATVGRDRAEVLAAGGLSAEALHILLGRFLYDQDRTQPPQVSFPQSLLPWTVPWGGQEISTGRFTHFSQRSPQAQLLRLRQWWSPTEAVPNANPISPQGPVSVMPTDFVREAQTANSRGDVASLTADSAVLRFPERRQATRVR